jgi:Fe2+ transport system protein FeoA
LNLNPYSPQRELATGTNSLDKIDPGMEVRVASLEQLPEAIRITLQAYGVLPGKLIRVLQHNPETVIEVESTELAFEKEVAEKVVVLLSAASS